MLPDSLRSSYKEYKADSEAIANWLATTARDRGYKLQNIATDPEKIQQAGKLKGRARKLARQAANTGQCADAPQPNATPDSTNCTPRRLIPVSEFVKLAIFIAKSKPSITIDETISSKLKAAIDERKRHHVYHTENSKYESNSGVSNDGHGYFISILESVWNILQPHFVKTPLSEQLPQSKAAGSQCVNSFEELRVEEASDTIENETTTEEPVSLADAPVEFGVKQDAQTDLEESFFAWQCLLGDYKRLRHYLQCIWKNYKNGLFDLSAVSIVSNTAIDFARGIEEEFTSLFPQADTEKFMSVIYWYECESAGIDPDARERPTDYINLAVYDAIEPWLIPIHQLLSAYGGILQSNILPAIKRGFHGIYDPSTDRSAKTNREKYLEAKIVLLEALPEFTVIAMHSDRIYAEDEIIRGMRQLVKTKKPSMWFTLACQIFLDIHHILRHEVSRGMSDLETVAKFVKTGIKSVLDFHKDLRTDSWPRKNDRYLTDLLGYINLWVDNDIIEWMRCRNIEGSNTAKPSSFFLLKQHPLLCGLMIFTIKLWSQHTGIMFANAWHSVLHCAHLYNAIRQERLLADPWKDMNLVLHAHKTETIFVGSFPRTNDDYCRRYYLAIGVSATILAKDNDRAIKNGWIRESKSGPRSLDWLCPVSRSIRRRYCEDAGLLTLSPADIERILTENAELYSANCIADASTPVTPSVIIKTRTDMCPIISRHSKRAIKRGLRPIQLLDSLLNALQSEAPELSINHFRLHMSCWRILRSIRAALGDEIDLVCEPGFFKVENRLPFLIGVILMSETGSVSELLKEQNGGVKRTMLAKAAEAVKTVLETGAGDIECRMLARVLGCEIEVPDPTDFKTGKI